jgi:Fic family protein
MATENLVHAYDLVYGALQIHGAEPRGQIDLMFIRALHETIVRGLPGRTHKSAWRQGPVNIKSPVTGEIQPCAYSADSLDAEMQRFTECYDKAIWNGMSPLLRAALAHQHLVKVHPFSDGNGRTARMIMQAILLESGWPALPLELAVTELRHQYLSVVTRSIEADDPALFIEFLLLAVETAIMRGISMMKSLRKEQDRLVAALVGLGMTPGHGRRLSDWALCNLMTPGSAPDWVRNTTLLAEDALDRTGLVDGLYHLGGVSYSSTLVRRLVAGATR